MAIFFDMRIIGRKNYLIILFIIASVTLMNSCTNKAVISEDQIARLNMYINSENQYIAEMFSDDVDGFGVQPALTQKELVILDLLVDRIPEDVRKGFDRKYTAWLNCWVPLDLMPDHMDITRQLLKCDGTEFKELIDYCKQQDDDVILLLCQVASRADCPYDQFLLHPVNDLLSNFPEFNNYWNEVGISLQNEKPDFKNRTCNESTIWYTRKILEARYGYTYSSGLVTLFNTQKMLLMNQ